jgi:hypothetical protein
MNLQDQGMDTQKAEALGYMARWALLGITAVAILVFTAAAVFSTVHLLTVPGSQLVMSDAIWTGDETFEHYVQGHVTPHPDKWETPMIIVRQPDGTLRMIYLEPDRMPLRITVPHDGVNVIDLLPVPYSRDGLKYWQTHVLDLGSTETLHLIDSHLLEEPMPEHLDRFQALVARLQSADRIVFVSSGTGPNFAEHAEWVQRVCPGALHVSSHRWGNVTTFPGNFMEVTGLSRAKRVNFFTGNWSSATRASGVGIATYVVNTEPPPSVEVGRRVTQFRSIGELLGYLDRLTQPGPEPATEREAPPAPRLDAPDQPSARSESPSGSEPTPSSIPSVDQE